MLRLALVVLLISSSGCGVPTLVSVQGRVFLDEKPLTTGKVLFHPDAEKGNKSAPIAQGEINAQGNYTVSSGTKQGAVPGWYRVAVNAMKPFDPEKPYAPEEWLIPRKYGDPQKSGLSIQIVESAVPGGYDLKLRSETK